MSLINQALKKAQNDRGGAPVALTQQVHQRTHRPQKNNTPLMLGLVALFAVLIGLVAGLSILVFGQQDSAPQQPAVQQAGAAPSTAPAAVNPEPRQQPKPQPIETAAAPTTPPVELNELQTARENAERDLQEKQAADAAATLARQQAEAKASSEEQANAIRIWLNEARINGIKLKGSSPKVVLNSKAYTIDDNVNFELGLSVRDIQRNLVIFVDEAGNEYTKRP